jgi:hypothetical protein
VGTKSLPSGYVTGYCQTGMHEGEQVRNYRGEPMQFCRGDWTTHLHGTHTKHSCVCGCHDVITRVMKLDRKAILRIIKGSVTGLETELLAEMCDTDPDVVERIARQPEFFTSVEWEPGERIWFSGKWWRDDDEGLVPVEQFVRPWEDPSYGLNRAQAASEVAPTVTANQREEELAEKGELTKDQMRVRRAIKVGILPPNPDYVESGRRGSSKVSEEQALATGLKHLGLSLREGLDLDGEAPDGESKNLRKAGQLEREVKEVCDRFTIGLMVDVTELTATEIAKAINVDNPPSTGAITNVLKRWAEVRFAVHLTGPHRFGGYTPEGIEQGIAGLTASQGRSARGAATKALHTFHRR